MVGVLAQKASVISFCNSLRLEVLLTLHRKILLIYKNQGLKLGQNLEKFVLLSYYPQLL